MGRIAINVIVYFKAFHIAGGCNKIEICIECFQAFVASVRLQVRIGINALCVGNIERIANSRIYSVSGFFWWSVSHIIHPLTTDERYDNGTDKCTQV